MRHADSDRAGRRPETQPPSVRLASAPSWTDADERRYRGGRPAYIVLGLLLISLMAVPVAITGGQSSLGYADAGSPGLWRWSPRVQQASGSMWSGRDTSAVGWGLAALPAVAGVLAIVGGCARGLGRSVFPLVAGVALLFVEPIVRGLAFSRRSYGLGSGSGMLAFEASMDISFFWPALFAILFTCMAVGGHCVASRERGRPSTRLAAFLPSLLAGVPLLVGLLLAADMLMNASQSVLPSVADARAVLAFTVILLGGVAALGMLFSAMLGLINAATGEARIASMGFLFGATGMVCLAIVFCLAASAHVVASGWHYGDAMQGWGVVVHTVLPVLAGLLLLTSGYRGLWTWVDREWGRARNAAHADPAVWPAAEGDGPAGAAESAAALGPPAGV